MMLRIVLFLAVGAAVVAGAWYLADVPGHVSLAIGDLTIETSTPVAIVLTVVLVAAILAIWWILGFVLGLPGAGARWRRRHRLASGEKAVTRVLVALAAGEQGTARKEAKRARALLGSTPQTLLLAAEAGRLGGQEAEATEAFQALAAHQDGRFLGLRGLLRQAIDRGDMTEALALAKQAEAAHPGTAWLRQQRAELALQSNNWPEAVAIIGSDPLRVTYGVAAADAEVDASRALAYAKQAWQQNKGFIPAAMAYARRLREAGKEKRAQACVAETWKQNPHPDLADFALAPVPDMLQRVMAAKRLVAGNVTHAESRFLLARVSLDARLVGEARNQIQLAEAAGIDQRRFRLLLAELEDQDRGQTEAGRAAHREALRRAATSGPDPRWQCTNCHTDHAVWQPKCSNCANVGTIEWRSGHRVVPMPVIAN